jgi:hypothetical protein
MRHIVASLTLAWGALGISSALHAEEKLPARQPIATALTAEQVAGFRVLDIRLAGLESVAAKIGDPDYRTSIEATIADFKKLRDKLKSNFEQAQFDTLNHNVNRHYQIVSLWLKPPRYRAPPEKDAAPASGEKKTQR